MQNVVTQHDVNDVALDRNIVAEATHSFSTVLDDWGVTNQARSGRCWMFAGLNLFRSESRNLLNVKEFEFSQSYVMFWDKMERANYILEAVIETADRPIDDRVVAWLAPPALGRRRPVGHVRQPGPQAWRCSQVGHARDREFREFHAHECRA